MPAADSALLIDFMRGTAPSDTPHERIEALYELAATHGLIGLVHETLEQRGILLPRWQAFAEQTELIAKVQLQAAIEISAALCAQNIDAVFAKGVALSLSVYPRALRPFNDLDLLIVPQNLRATHRVLSGLGYSADNSLRNPFELDYKRERLPGFRICVDLHWDFTGEDGMQAGARLPMSEIISRSGRVRDIPIPSHEDALLLAAANFARKCGEPLMLVVDFAKLLALPLDWNALVGRATRWGLKTPLWAGIFLASQMFGATAPTDVMERLQPPLWRRKRLLKLLRTEALWHLDKQKLLRYRVGFKLLCLDSWGRVGVTLASSPKSLLRKMGITENLAAAILRENPVPLVSANRT